MNIRTGENARSMLKLSRHVLMNKTSRKRDKCLLQDKSKERTTGYMKKKSLSTTKDDKKKSQFTTNWRVSLKRRWSTCEYTTLVQVCHDVTLNVLVAKQTAELH